MKHLYEAATLIQSAGIAEIGTDLFVGTMPHDVRRGISLIDPLFGADLDEGLDGFVVHQFQIVVRDIDPAAAWAKAKAASDVLRVEQYQGSGITITHMYPLTLPATYPAMDSDELETSVRMRVAFKLT